VRRSVIGFILGLVYAFVFLAHQNVSYAHDLGVSKLQLNEFQNSRYELLISARPSQSHLYNAPSIPENCKFEGSPNGAQGVDFLRFEFTCSTFMKAADSLSFKWDREGIFVSANWADGRKTSALFRRDVDTILMPLSKLQAGSGSWADAAKRYLGLGIEHILFGIDHLLFVFALLLFVRGPLLLVKTITAFTIAHSLTLALATFGIVHVPIRPVEATIALSIVFVCWDITRAQNGHKGLTFQYPWIVAFVFGLLHGLGFAGALSEVGLPLGEIPVALLYFNIGVEVGQLIFVAMVLTILWLLRKMRLRSVVWLETIPVYFVGTIASYWFIQRFVLILSAG
jgi:hypothetical protein